MRSEGYYLHWKIQIQNMQTWICFKKLVYFEHKNCENCLCVYLIYMLIFFLKGRKEVIKNEESVFDKNCLNFTSKLKGSHHICPSPAFLKTQNISATSKREIN